MNDLGRDKEFDKLDLRKLVLLADKYKARYVVVPASKELDLEMVHENSGYRIYRFHRE